MFCCACARKAKQSHLSNQVKSRKEINNFNVTVGLSKDSTCLDCEGVVDEDVVTLDISMDDAEGVHVEEGAGDISSDAQSHLRLELNSLF